MRPDGPAKAALAALVLLGAGCPSRARLPRQGERGDGGPAVVVVERGQANAGAQSPRGRGPAREVQLLDEREPNDERAQAQPIELVPGGAARGVRAGIGAAVAGAKGKAPQGDEDYYVLVVPRTDGGSALFSARVELAGAPGLALALEAQDAAGHRIAQPGGAEAGAPTVIPNLAIGGAPVYLRVRAAASEGRSPAAGGAAPAASVGAYTLAVSMQPLREGEEIEPNDRLEQATPIAAEASGYFGRRHDEDWLRIAGASSEGGRAGDGGAGGVELPPSLQGGTLRIEMSAVEGVAPSLRVTDAAGHALCEAKAGKGEELRLRNAPSGTFVVLRAESGANVDIPWSLRVREQAAFDGAEVEPNDRRASATAIVLPSGAGGAPLSASVAGFLWPGDLDVYRVHLEGPALVRAELEVPERVDGKLEWMGEGDGRARMRADDAGPGKPEALPPLYTAGGPGEVFLRVSARPHDTVFDAPYQLTVSVEPDDGATEHEPNDAPALATPLPGGRPTLAIRGFLAPRGDEDWFRAVAPATGASTARVSLERAPKGAVVKILDEARASLGGGEGASASAPVAASQPFLILVRDPAGKAAAPREPYQLTVAFE